MTVNQRFLHCVLTLSTVLSLVVTNSAFPSKRSRTAKRIPVRIVLDKSELKLGPNQTVEVKAKVLDAHDKQIPNAKIVWKLAEGAENSIVIRPVDKAETDILISATDDGSRTGNVKIQAQSGAASADINLILQNSTAGEIVFPKGNTIDLAVGAKETVRVYVMNTQGNQIRGADVNWRLADPNLEAFVYLGRAINSNDVNSVEVLWRPGKAEIEIPTTVPVIATAGSALGVLTVNYKPASTPTYKVTFDKVDNKDKKELKIGPGDSDSVKVTIRGDKDSIVDVKPTVEIADEIGKKFITATVGADKKTITVVGLYGDDPKSAPTSLPTSLVVRAGNGVATIPVIYQRDAASIDWTIVPPNIVGDNYGRTIKKDYYCIEVTIQNNSGSDLALAGLRFVTKQGGIEVGRPNTGYAIVHGSLARRKLTHPRTMTLAIIDGLGSLMTGFNPFFHNTNHAKNFSQFIDILSNPLAKGLDKAWKDPYPDELARFEQDVLRDDKIIPSAGIFKTRIFVPKRALFNSGDKDRENLDIVRVKLGTLWVMGYKFQKGPILGIGSRP